MVSSPHRIHRTDHPCRSPTHRMYVFLLHRHARRRGTSGPHRRRIRHQLHSQSLHPRPQRFYQRYGSRDELRTLLGLKPDVVLLYGIGDAQTAVTDKLKELAIPYMYVGEYLEESPLGKAEWLVALSELTDSRDKGIDVFREIPKRYQALKDLTASVEQRPTVMFNTPWNDSWVMPSTQSYMVQLVTDAGADYIYKENTSNSSAPIGLETAYGLIQKADYWINVGTASTLDELKNMNPKFADAKSVRDKTVYNNNLRITATGGNDYWESAVVRPDVVLRDLIHIFHPELISDSTYYYRHLE